MAIRHRFYKSLSVAISATILSGCATDLPENPAETGQDLSIESKIEIFGGNPVGLDGESRTVYDPSRPGVCDADRCKIWFFEGAVHTSSLNYPTIGASLVSIADSVIVPADRYGDLYAQNKLASCYRDFTAKSQLGTLYHYTASGIVSLAYEEKDADKFRTDIKSFGNKMNNLFLALNGSETPELYFGRLTMPVFEEDKNQEKQDVMMQSQDGIYYYYNNTLNDIERLNNPVTGKLYRIVSQLNVTINGVPEGEVEKIEMYLSNIPDQMTLFGNHGHFYHVSPASHHLGLTSKDDAKDRANGYKDYVLAATCDHFHRGEARLSTFLLPSTLGRAMMIRVYFPEGKQFDKQGNPILFKDFEIRPAESVFMQGNDAEVYILGAPEKLKHGDDLYIYNYTANEFYSYSNVRININGEFDNILRETTDVGLTIEVCPSFQQYHEFNFE